MSRLLPFIAALSLVACTSDFGDTASVPTDPSIEGGEFPIEVPNDGVDNDGDGVVDEGLVDTGWPSYNGGRRRSLESGWRRAPVNTLND